MANIYNSGKWIKYAFLLAAILIAIISSIAFDSLIKKLADEERQKMEVWGDATRAAISQDPSINMALMLKIIEGNTSIPVFLCDANDSIIAYKNIIFPEHNKDTFKRKKLEELKNKNEPIIIDLGGGTYQYIYYDDSILLKQLLLYPYAQLIIVIIFISVAFTAILSFKKAEQNKIWAGLSKETAHQLGTPISSLMAWTEYLQAKGTEPAVLYEIEKDIKHLQRVAERFSKIGSIPHAEPQNIVFLLQNSIEYMQTRISSKVQIDMVNPPQKAVFAAVDKILFSWVIENLIKNAVDAMEGQGHISINISDTDEKKIRIDVSDTGKGIPKSKFNTIFNPGYTTKKRGWGLGLSLAKRIITSCHKGKIFVKNSEMGKGSTIRIVLPKKGNEHKF